MKGILRTIAACSAAGNKKKAVLTGFGAFSTTELQSITFVSNGWCQGYTGNGTFVSDCIRDSVIRLYGTTLQFNIPIDNVYLEFTGITQAQGIPLIITNLSINGIAAGSKIITKNGKYYISLPKGTQYLTHPDSAVIINPKIVKGIFPKFMGEFSRLTNITSTSWEGIFATQGSATFDSSNYYTYTMNSLPQQSIAIDIYNGDINNLNVKFLNPNMYNLTALFAADSHSSNSYNNCILDFSDISNNTYLWMSWASSPSINNSIIIISDTASLGTYKWDGRGSFTFNNTIILRKSDAAAQEYINRFK